ncbi:MAG: radical SAM protein, partial [Deltaproteobacteria bacterium]|nr:radical SAM protein [Deltaproteobacteria bacterium]
MSELVLIQPPVAIPTEPPIGIATLAGALRARGVSVVVVDAGIEALHAVMAGLGEAGTGEAHTIAERRAIAGVDLALSTLRSPAGYTDFDRYRRAVADLGRVLEVHGRRSFPPARIGLASYQEQERSPLSSDDLRRAAAVSRCSPFAVYFSSLAERVARTAPRAVGISVNYLHQALPAMALAGMLRERLGPGVPILAGGGLVRGWQGRLAPDALRPALDLLVFDHGLPLLLEVLGCGHAAAAPAAPPDRPCPPDYTGLPWELYLAPQRVVPLTTTHGCSWRRCRYCPEALAIRDFSAVPAAELARFVEPVLERSGAGLLHLADSTVPEEALAALAEHPLPVPWYGFTRFARLLAQPEQARRLRNSGCVMLQLGLESAS